MDKINLFLDLDQTIISGEPTKEIDFSKNKQKMKNFIFHDMDNYYIIFERPGLQKFLTYIFDNFNVSVWTAASKDYALFILKNIILGNNSNRKIDYFLFSHHCDISQDLSSKKGTKDLSILWNFFCIQGYNKNNTIIIDDYDNVYKTQPSNCIIAPPFEFTKDNSKDDTFLPELTDKLRILLQKNNSSNLPKLIKNINKK